MKNMHSQGKMSRLIHNIDTRMYWFVKSLLYYKMYFYQLYFQNSTSHNTSAPLNRSAQQDLELEQLSAGNDSNQRCCQRLPLTASILISARHLVTSSTKQILIYLFYNQYLTVINTNKAQQHSHNHACYFLGKRSNLILCKRYHVTTRSYKILRTVKSCNSGLKC